MNLDHDVQNQSERKFKKYRQIQNKGSTSSILGVPGTFLIPFPGTLAPRVLSKNLLTDSEDSARSGPQVRLKTLSPIISKKLMGDTQA